MRILWAGFGDLGSRAVPSLRAAGHEVVALRRTPFEDAPDGVTPLTGDLVAPDGLALPPDIDACVVTMTPASRDRAGYQAAYVESMVHLHRLLDAATSPSRAHPVRVVFASSTAVYGDDDGSWVEEAAGTSPTAFNGEVMEVAEARVLGHETTNGVVARLGGIYGPGRERLIRSVRDGRPTSRRWTNRIHADDAATALAHLATARPHQVPDVVNVVDHRPARKSDVTDFLAAELGVPAPPVDADEPSHGDLGKRVDGTRLRTTGFIHQYPTFEQGYRQVLAAAADAD